jgi:hypothetical protein
MISEELWGVTVHFLTSLMIGAFYAIAKGIVTEMGFKTDQIQSHC